MVKPINSELQKMLKRIENEPDGYFITVFKDNDVWFTANMSLMHLEIIASHLELKAREMIDGKPKQTKH